MLCLYVVWYDVMSCNLDLYVCKYLILYTPVMYVYLLYMYVTLYTYGRNLQLYCE